MQLYKKLSAIFSFGVLILFAPLSFASVKFVHLTDPHLFEVAGKENESADSAVHFRTTITYINTMENPKNKKKLSFVVLTGDLGVEKLITKSQISSGEAKKKPNTVVIEEDGKLFELTKNKEKWNSGLKTLANIIAKSKSKLWLMVPGNNDLYDEIPSTIIFYADFIKDLKATVQAKNTDIRIVDFRLESQDSIEGFKPGTLKIGDKLFIGWDNSFFKNNYSIKRFLDKNKKPISIEQLAEYKSLQKLSDVINTSDAKYVYIFYHIPEVDDPWRINFDVDPDDPDDNTVSQALKEAARLSPELAKGIYPYSAWMIPIEIRKMWENLIVSPLGRVEIMGLFAGHFHDPQREIYNGFKWLRDVRYKPEILSILHIAPSISAKNQHTAAPKDRSRGGEVVFIDDLGRVKVERFFWTN